jgi:putative endonuclease
MFFGYTKPCMKRFSSATQMVGKVGEDIACRFLEQKGFTVIERNYTKPWGEIDVVTVKDNAVHFIEVKTIATHNGDTPWVRPAENMTPSKMKKCERAAESYVLEKKVVGEWFYDAVFVTLDEGVKKAQVELLLNIFRG